MALININSTVLLCVDLQKCYYQSPITELFPVLEKNVTRTLQVCRASDIKVVHVRQEDVEGVSKWLPWWRELHPGDSLGVPEPLECAREKDSEPIFIKNTFDGFHGTQLDSYLK